MASGRASARGQERADVRVRLPMSRDGPSGAEATSDTDPELEPGHQTRRSQHQQTAAPSPAHPSRDTRPPDAQTPPRSRPTTSLPRLIWIPSRPPRESSPRLTRIPAYLPCPDPLPPPRRRPTSARLSLPAPFTWQVEEGGSGAKRRTPLPPKPRREAKETPRGGAVACCAYGRNPWRETNGGKQMEGNRCP
jgi:hypothetical protein